MLYGMYDKSTKVPAKNYKYSAGFFL